MTDALFEQAVELSYSFRKAYKDHFDGVITQEEFNQAVGRFQQDVVNSSSELQEYMFANTGWHDEATRRVENAN